MTITVSISDFRQNLSDYITKVKEGDTIVLKDEKKGEELAHVNPVKKSTIGDLLAYVKKNGPIFTTKNHPEWRTKKDVAAWVRKSRKEAERDFSYIPRSE